MTAGAGSDLPDPRRAGPREVEYSGLWYDKNTEPPWRVAWIEATGELYAVRRTEPGAGDEVELLGHFPTRGDVEIALRGWSKVHGVQGSMPWVRHAAGRSPSDTS